MDVRKLLNACRAEAKNDTKFRDWRRLKCSPEDWWDSIYGNQKEFKHSDDEEKNLKVYFINYLMSALEDYLMIDDTPRTIFKQLEIIVKHQSSLQVTHKKSWAGAYKFVAKLCMDSFEEAARSE